LQAEFTKARLRRRLPSIDTLRTYVNGGQEGKVTVEAQDGGGQGVTVNDSKEWSHPRWVRINTLKTSLQEQLDTTFSAYESVSTVSEILHATLSYPPPKLLHIDLHIPNLIALPIATDVSTSMAYKQGHLILQDKASCFPAYLLNPQREDGDIIDACAAPGNKTTHVAALLHSLRALKMQSRIWACERDKARAMTLQKMISIAGADDLVSVRAGQDFLRLNPEEEPWCEVGALLLDPSCSGSGIIGRDAANTPTISLPSREATNPQSTLSKKRKRRKPGPGPHPSRPQVEVETRDESPPHNTDTAEALQRRLSALSTFQTLLLTHAFRFPRARKITYSTCSIHAEENERVVLAALSSPVAKAAGWKILRREEQVEGMRKWPVRGDMIACGGDTDVAEGCIRCEKGTEEGTMGFFVAGFVRDLDEEAGVDVPVEWKLDGDGDGEDEWSGCSDS
jgi:putative methyltransferase